MMKLKKYLFMMINSILVFVIPVITVYATDGSMPGAVLKADQSVVRVVVPLGDIYNDGGYYYQEGSAFVIGQSGGSTYLMTNRHVVSLMNQGEQNVMRYVYVLRENAEGAILDATVIEPPNSSIDLVFLRVDTGLASRPALRIAKSETVKRGDACYAAGFPDAADQIRDDGKNLPSSPEDVTFSAGVISQIGGEYQGQKTIQITAHISNGNSGGPLLNHKGDVIGINTYGNDNINKSIFSDYIIEAADRLDVPYTLAEEGLPIVSIAGICVGVLAIVSILIILSRRKKKAEKLPSSCEFKQTGSSPSTPSNSHPSNTRPSQSGAPRGIRGTGGQYKNTTFDVGERTLIGRDPTRCSIVFAAQTPGVGSLHCEILRVGEGFKIIDHKSKYGTFLSGAKIQQNVPVVLKVGSSFYLGDPRNSFIVY